MNFRTVVWIAASCIALTTQSANGGWVGYNFAASALPTTQVPFGYSAASFNPVAGHFAFDTATPAEPLPSPSAACLVAGTDCLLYRQHYPGGLAGTFNGLAVSADDYVILVSNHIQQSPGVYADIVNIRWSSNLGLSPAIGSLTVQGAPKAVGIFTLNLSGPDSLFSNASLPTSLNYLNFPSRTSWVADTPTGILDVVFTISSMTSFQVADPPGVGMPEPGCGILLALVLGLGGGRQIVRRRRSVALRP